MNQDAEYWKKHARRHEQRAKRHHAALTVARDQLEAVLDLIDDALEPEPVPPTEPIRRSGSLL